MGATKVRRRCLDRLRSLDFPRPYSAEALAARLAVERGRPMHLVARQGPLDGPCGVWLGTAEEDVLLYDPRSSGLHREHILAHELSHVLFAHGESGTVVPAVVAQLTDMIDPATVLRMLSRTSYSSTEEQEAEVLASLIMREAHDVTSLSAVLSSTADEAVDPELERFDDLLSARPLRAGAARQRG